MGASHWSLIENVVSKYTARKNGAEARYLKNGYVVALEKVLQPSPYSNRAAPPRLPPALPIQIK